MSLFLKQSTAVVVSYGVFVDKTDGVTEETGLVSALDHGTTGIKLSKNGGALTIRHATVTATTYDAYGMYRVTLDTTDTNTLGTLRMAFNEAATCLPVWQDFMVLPANIYDSIVSGSDLIDVSMTQILGTAVSSPATAGILDVNVKNIDNDAASASGTVTFPNATLASTTNITAAAGCAVSSIGANVITATSINADAITAAKIAAGAIDNATFAADVGSTAYATNIIALAADKAIANAALATAANLAAAKTVVDAVKVKTDYLPSATAGAAGGVFIAGENAETTVDFVGGLSGTVGSVTGNVGGNVTGSVGSVVGAVGSVTAAVTLPTIPTNWITANGIAADAIGASELAADAVTEIAAGISIPSAATIASQVRTELTTELGRIDVATSTRLATAGYTAPLDAAGIRTAVGLATANLDTQLTAIDDLLDTEVAAIKAKTDLIPASPSSLDAAGVRAAVGLASANLDTQLAAIDDAVDTEVAAIYSRLGAPAGASMSADIAAVKAETALIQAKTTNLPAAPASTTNITQATGIDITKILGTAISTPATAGILDVNIVNIGGSAADLGATPGMLDVRLAEVSLGGGTQLRANLGLATADLDTQLAALPTAAEIADANWDEALSGHLTAGTTGKALSDAGAAGTPLDAAGVRAAIGLAAANLDTQLDSIPTAAENAAANPALSAAGVRSAVGLASANLDTQLTAIDDLIDTEVAAIKTVVDGIDTKMGMPNITLADDIGAPVVSLGADVQAVKVVVDTIAGYLDTEIAAIKAKTDNLPASPSSLDAAGVRTAIGMASANLDTQLGNTYNRIGAPVFGNISGDIAANYAILTNIEDSVGVGVSADVVAIKAKTDNLPADPASSTNVTAVYSRVGAPAGASVSADIAAVKAETATINTATGAAAIRTAVGMATANLDTQLAAIDDLLDTEIGAIKAKTDLIPASPAAVGSAMTLADGAITDAKIAELAFQGKHFDTDVEIASVAGAVGSVTAGVTVTTNNDKTGYTLTSGERNSVADALLDRADAIATGLTLRQGIAVTLAAVAAKLSGAATATITVRDINDTKNVLVITVDANGNRTAVTVTP